MVITGTGGALTVGPRVAGRLGAWQLTRQGLRPEFDAALTVPHRDLFWWTVTPVTVSLAVGRRRWQWPVEALPAPADEIYVRLVGVPQIV